MITVDEYWKLIAGLLQQRENQLAYAQSANRLNPEICQDEAAEYRKVVEAYQLTMQFSACGDPRQRPLL